MCPLDRVLTYKNLIYLLNLQFCGHFMVEWDEHHYCPKCRDDLKGDDPCANSSDCVICSTFSEDQKKKIRNRNRYKSKKDQSSSVSVDNGGKEGSIDDC